MTEPKYLQNIFYYTNPLAQYLWLSSGGEKAAATNTWSHMKKSARETDRETNRQTDRETETQTTI